MSLELLIVVCFFFLNDPATTEISPLPLHAALPISRTGETSNRARSSATTAGASTSRRTRSGGTGIRPRPHRGRRGSARRSEEHTAELQSRQYFVCRLLLEKKKKNFDKSDTIILTYA